MPDMLKTPQDAAGPYDLGRLLRLAQENLDGKVEGRDLPPVDQWNPTLCGEIDIRIKANGTWWHEGSMIRRKGLVNLFSTILRREGDDYYLVTPAEKLLIKVERAPFMATRVDREGEGEGQSLFFTINNGDTVEAGPKRPIRVEELDDGQPAPFVRVRKNLDAAIHRPAFYEMADYAIEKDGRLGVWSGGVFFDLGHDA